MTKRIFQIAIFITLIGCTDEENMNFICVVDEKDNAKSYHLVSMFESENFELLNENDSLFSLYLNDLEIETAKQNIDSTRALRNKYRHQYHLIEKRKFNDNTIILIGRSIIGNGRNYAILFRVLDDQGEILNTLTVAAWNEQGKNFYGCEISDNWSKIKHIINGKAIREFIIDSQWQTKTGK